MQDSYRHEALPYSGREDLLSSSAQVVRDALADDHRLIVLYDSDPLGELRDLLGTDASEVSFVPTDEHGRNPCRITTMLYGFQSTGDGRRSTALVEPTFGGRSPAAMDEVLFAEAVLNDPALREWALTLVCRWDCSALDDWVCEALEHSHPLDGGDHPNPDFDAELAIDTFTSVPKDAPQGSALLDVEPADLADMRAFVRGHAAARGIAPDRVDDLVLAVNEIVTNSLRHGGGRCRIAVWAENDAVVCEVRDSGVITDPLVGRLPPPPAASDGRGLWLANHLCDLVQIRSSGDGTVVRLFVDR